MAISAEIVDDVVVDVQTGSSTREIVVGDEGRVSGTRRSMQLLLCKSLGMVWANKSRKSAVMYKE